MAGATVRTTVVSGPICSGKTGALVDQVMGLVAAGADLAKVLVVCPGRDGAKALRARLAQAGRLAGSEQAEAVEGIRCLSARALALEVLGQPEVVGSAGHGPRVLLDVERALLVADLRLRGFDRKQVAQAFRSLEHAWAAGDLPDAKPGTCERAVLDAYGERRAFDTCELAARARAGLAAAPGLLGRLGADHVLVDDANMLSTGALRLVQALAGEDLTLFGNPQLANGFFDAAARPEAFLEFARGEGAELRDLSAPVGSRPLGTPRAYLVKSRDPQAEAQVALAVTEAAIANPLDRPAFGEAACAAGADGLAVAAEEAADPVAAGVLAGDFVARREPADQDEPRMYNNEVFVVVPTGQAGARVRKALADRRIESEAALDHQPIAGDPRHIATVSRLQSFALLGIVADPADAASWRSWLALGRPDVGCATWQGLLAFAQAKGVDVVDALAQLADTGGKADPFEGASLAARRYAQAKGLADKARHKHGRSVLDVVCPVEDGDFERLCEPVVAQDASELMARVMSRTVDRGFGERHACVRVGVAGAFAGLPCRVLTDLGCNEGVVPRSSARPAESPAAQAAAQRAADQAFAAHEALWARTTDMLVISYAQRYPKDAAEKIGAQIRRTRPAPDGTTLAVLAPSARLARLGAWLPSTMSDQQFMGGVLNIRA